MEVLADLVGVFSTALEPVSSPVIQTEGSHMMFQDLIVVPVGPRGPGGPYNCSGDPLMNKVAPGDPMGSWGPRGP